MSPAEAHEHRSKRRRSQSAERHGHRSHKRRSHSPPAKPVRLPLNARPLSKHDLSEYRATFALYLDIQKNIDLDELEADEVKGRWKSFMGKWNRGDLAEGWFDPATKQKADKSASELLPPTRSIEETRESSKPVDKGAKVSDDEDDDDYGPSLPAQHGGRSQLGPAVPSLQDLQHRNELSQEDQEARREDARYARKQERKAQKERLDEIAPRAEAGTKERQLEKKREITAANRSFREAKSPGAEEVPERDVMGDDGLEGYKAHLQATERKKNERELRKEEILRAREAERAEKMAEHRAKEDKTMDMLKQLAKQRYG